MMYQMNDNVLTISVNDWCKAGLTRDMFENDSKRGYLTIHRRGINGNTLIDVRSIKRNDRLMVIESVHGKIEKNGDRPVMLFEFNIDIDARMYYLEQIAKGITISNERIEEYVNRASIFNGMKETLIKHTNARASKQKRPMMGLFYEESLLWYKEQCVINKCPMIKNARSLERAFKQYLKDGYSSIMHKGLGNDFARVVSNSAGKLLVAIYRMNDKPFVSRVHELYLEFISGNKELYDKSTGEIYRPEDFRHKGRAMEISLPTVWNYLKDIVNETSVYMDRNGNFDYVNTKRPKQHRKLGKFSLSKISMDDVALSRKSIRGWVYKYIAVDVVSGYWFRPAYIVGKPTVNTVIESFRNMFCELSDMGLPMPGELEVEYHLMKNIEWLNELFPFVRFCESPTEKRAEHNIRSFKYGVSKKEGHTRGRWYAKHEAYRSVRNKVNGDFVEPEYQPQTIIADDLADIEKHNNELHPLQKTYPGMTRKQVFLANINPSLKKIDNWHLFRYIGNEIETSIRNNDYCRVSNQDFEITEFNSLKRLKPNNTEVIAYWMPEEDGSIKRVYLYQDGTYIGEAINREQFDYNECAFERTEEDETAMLHQNKRLSKYDKFIKEQRAEIPKVGQMDALESQIIKNITVEILDTPVEEEVYEESMAGDWAALAISSL